jgi:hypothetical protein
MADQLPDFDRIQDNLVQVAEDLGRIRNIEAAAQGQRILAAIDALTDRIDALSNRMDARFTDLQTEMKAR